MTGVDIITKLQPLTDLIKAVAYPCAYGMVIFGFIKIALSDSITGKKTIKNAMYGYIGVQATPLIFEIIDSIF